MSAISSGLYPRFKWLWPPRQENVHVIDSRTSGGGREERELVQKAAREEEYLRLGQGLAQAVPLPDSVGDHRRVGHKSASLRVQEPFRVK